MPRKLVQDSYRGWYGWESRFNSAIRMSIESMWTTNVKNERERFRHSKVMSYLKEEERDYVVQSSKDVSKTKKELLEMLAYGTAYREYSFDRWNKRSGTGSPKVLRLRGRLDHLIPKTPSSQTCTRARGDMGSNTLREDGLQGVVNNSGSAIDLAGGALAQQLEDDTALSKDINASGDVEFSIETSDAVNESKPGRDSETVTVSVKAEDNGKANTVPEAGNSNDESETEQGSGTGGAIRTGQAVAEERKRQPTALLLGPTAEPRSNRLVNRSNRLSKSATVVKEEVLPSYIPGSLNLRSNAKLKEVQEPRVTVWERVVHKPHSKRSTVFPEECRSVFTLRRMIDRKARSLVQHWSPESARKQRVRKILDRVQLPRLVERSKTTSAIFRDYQNYKENVANSDAGGGRDRQQIIQPVKTIVRPVGKLPTRPVPTSQEYKQQPRCNVGPLAMPTRLRSVDRVV